jgi:hypothetical protein
MASRMTKNIDIRHYYYTREPVDARTMAVVSIPTSNIMDDGIIKALPQPKHTMLFNRCLGSS